MKKIKLGIIGIGNMGTAHANNILAGKCPEIELVAVADTDLGRLEWAKEKLPEQVKRFDNAEDMIKSGLVDSVLVAVPHYDHPKYAKMCFANGLHVMAEKPAGVYTKQVNEMNEAAQKSNVVFGMMFNQRTDHIYRKMREIVQSSELGNIRRTSWIVTDWYRPQAYYNSGNWRATWSGEGGGVLLNQCPHNLDLWQWICGMPSLVDARLHFGKWHDIEVEDDVTAYVEYENGATGTFITSTGDTPGTNRFEITLDGGKLVAENGNGDTAKRCLEIHKHIPDMYAIFDPANFVQCNEDTLKAWELLGDYVKYMHIKDAIYNGKVVPAGKGDGNIPEIIKKYKANGGTVLTLEPHLAVFSGLEDLEGGEKSIVEDYAYPSARQAFDAAVSALKALI